MKSLTRRSILVTAVCVALSKVLPRTARAAACDCMGGLDIEFEYLFAIDNENDWQKCRYRSLGSRWRKRGANHWHKTVRGSPVPPHDPSPKIVWQRVPYEPK